MKTHPRNSLVTKIGAFALGMTLVFAATNSEARGGGGGGHGGGHSPSMHNGGNPMGGGGMSNARRPDDRVVLPVRGTLVGDGNGYRPTGGIVQGGPIVRDHSGGPGGSGGPVGGPGRGPAGYSHVGFGNGPANARGDPRPNPNTRPVVRDHRQIQTWHPPGRGGGRGNNNY